MDFYLSNYQWLFVRVYVCVCIGISLIYFHLKIIMKYNYPNLQSHLNKMIAVRFSL